jgi:hypothetical protein
MDRRTQSRLTLGAACWSALLVGCINHDQLQLANPSPCHIVCCHDYSPIAPLDPCCHGYHSTCWQPWSAECPTCPPPAAGVAAPALLPAPEENNLRMPEEIPQPSALPATAPPTKLQFPSSLDANQRVAFLSPTANRAGAQAIATNVPPVGAAVGISTGREPRTDRAPALLSASAGQPVPVNTDNRSGAPAAPYSRAQAIDCGRLVDVSELARHIGFRSPVAISWDVWSKCVAVTGPDASQRETARLADILQTLMSRVQTAPREPVVLWEVPSASAGGDPKPQQLKAHCGPGDHAESVITIMLPEEA